MKKIALCLLISSILLVGCSKNDRTELADTQKETSETSTLESSIEESTEESIAEPIEFSVFKPRYDENEDGTHIVKIQGTAENGSTIDLYADNKKIDTTSAEDGTFIFTPELLDKPMTYEIHYLDQTEKIDALALSDIAKVSQNVDVNSEKANAEAKKRAENRPEPVTTESSAEDETEPDQIEVTNITQDQKDQLIVWTQMSSKEKGRKLTYQGDDYWNIAHQYTQGKNKWIVTTEDKNYGRVKSIIEWDGDNDSEAKMTYLLITGNELINTLEN